MTRKYQKLCENVWLHKKNDQRQREKSPGAKRIITKESNMFYDHQLRKKNEVTEAKYEVYRFRQLLEIADRNECDSGACRRFHSFRCRSRQIERLPA